MSSASPIRTAEIVAVGSELLGAVRVDTNSLYLTSQLAALGIEVRTKHVVGDHRPTLARVFEEARARADLIVFTGGLGPTDDDLTREVVADVLGREIDIDEAIVERIRARFARRGMTMPEVNRRQAQVPRGATVLENPNGTAPGLLLEDAHRLVVLLPGPPREVQPMFTRLCEGVLGERAGAERLYTASLFITGRSESDVEQRVQPIYSTWRDADPPIETTILAVMGQIELHLTMRGTGAAAARARVDAARDELARALGDDVYSTDGRSMPEVVGELLARGDDGVAAPCHELLAAGAADRGERVQPLPRPGRGAGVARPFHGRQGVVVRNDGDAEAGEEGGRSAACLVAVHHVGPYLPRRLAGGAEVGPERLRVRRPAGTEVHRAAVHAHVEHVDAEPGQPAAEMERPQELPERRAGIEVRDDQDTHRHHDSIVGCRQTARPVADWTSVQRRGIGEAPVATLGLR